MESSWGKGDMWKDSAVMAPREQGRCWTTDSKKRNKVEDKEEEEDENVEDNENEE
jgi:hypothetical protein